MPKHNPLYTAWWNMQRRCTVPGSEDFPRYGGRGIKVCVRWGSYANFAVDMGPHPGAGLTLDRKRNNEGYRRGNCRWATRTAQAINRRTTKLSQSEGATIRWLYDTGWGSMQRLAEHYGVTKSTIFRVVRRGLW